jgi:hypothetical protein
MSRVVRQVELSPRPLILCAMTDDQVSAACEESLSEDRELLRNYKEYTAGHRAQLAQLIRTDKEGS